MERSRRMLLTQHLTTLGIDRLGLDELDRNILGIIARDFGEVRSGKDDRNISR